MLRALDKLAYTPLIIAAILLAAAPFFPQPHLVEKIKMLVNGTLHKGIDIFDLCMHASGLVILALKVIRDLIKRNSN